MLGVHKQVSDHLVRQQKTYIQNEKILLVYTYRLEKKPKYYLKNFSSILYIFQELEN